MENLERMIYLHQAVTMLRNESGNQVWQAVTIKYYFFSPETWHKIMENIYFSLGFHKKKVLKPVLQYQRKIEIVRRCRKFTMFIL